MIAQRVSAGTGADLEQAISAMRQESFQRHSFRAVLVGTIFGIPEPRLVVRAFVVTDWNRVVARRHRMSVSPRAYVLLEDCTPMRGADFGRLSCIRCKHFGGSAGGRPPPSPCNPPHRPRRPLRFGPCAARRRREADR